MVFFPAKFIKFHIDANGKGSILCNISLSPVLFVCFYDVLILFGVFKTETQHIS